MTKNDFFDLIVKGFGVYLLVLAIMQISSLITGIILFINYLSINFPNDAVTSMNTLRVTMLSASLGGTIKFIVYIFAAVNFLRSGSWVKKIMGKRKTTEQSAITD